MKIEIKNRWTNACLWSGEAATIKEAVEAALASDADLSGAYLSRAYLRGADLSGAYLRGADLSGADLRGADLRDADLSGADLRGADLRDADLSRAYLRGDDLSRAYLRGADLSGANLSGAYLRDANLSGAYLRPIKADVWEILAHAIPEIPALIAALKEGRVDGSTYSGDCACLVGTVAQARGCDEDGIPGITPNAYRPAERFFLAIRKGDTPETNQASKIALEWADEFLRLVTPEGQATA